MVLSAKESSDWHRGNVLKIHKAVATHMAHFINNPNAIHLDNV